MDGLELSKQSIRRAMREANTIVSESVERIYKYDIYTSKAINVAIEGYEKCLNAFLKLGGTNVNGSSEKSQQEIRSK